LISILGLFTFVAFLIYLFAAVAHTWFEFTKKAFVFNLAKVFVVVGFVLNTAALAVRIGVSGRLPVANTYEFLLSFAWATVGLFLLFLVRGKVQVAGAPVMFIAALLLGLIVFLMPGEQYKVAPLVPSLKSGWLAVHVLTAVLAYAAFAFGAGLAAVYLLKGTKQKHLEEVVPQNLEEQMYKVIIFGFTMLSLTIVFGAIWAEQAWGSYWSWDPKETWSLFTWIVYALYLHFRRKRYWKGRISAAMVLLGFFLVLFTFFGVNYLMSGLHSY